MVPRKSGMISWATRAGRAESAAKMTALPFAWARRWMFLSRDGPAETIIAGMFLNLPASSARNRLWCMELRWCSRFSRNSRPMKLRVLPSILYELQWSQTAWWSCLYSVKLSENEGRCCRFWMFSSCRALVAGVRTAATFCSGPMPRMTLGSESSGVRSMACRAWRNIPEFGSKTARCLRLRRCWIKVRGV